MANEITISSTLRYSKSPTSASLTASSQFSQVGTKFESGIQTIGTTEEALQKGDVGTIGYVAIRNTDATNYVEVGSTTGVYSIKLLPGKGCVVPWNASTVLIKANTAACDVEYLIIEL